MGLRVEDIQAFALEYHHAQTDKLGYPYSAHLEDVLRRVSDRGSLIVCIAWLSSPLGLYHLAAVSLITFLAREGACRGLGAGGYDCTG